VIAAKVAFSGQLYGENIDEEVGTYGCSPFQIYFRERK
jgi:hypothetical protein